jgi:hypothetical protein
MRLCLRGITRNPTWLWGDRWRAPIRETGTRAKTAMLAGRRPYPTQGEDAAAVDWRTSAWVGDGETRCQTASAGRGVGVVYMKLSCEGIWGGRKTREVWLSNKNAANSMAGSRQVLIISYLKIRFCEIQVLIISCLKIKSNWAYSRVCQINLVSIYFWQNRKNCAPTVWYPTWQILATWQISPLHAHICALSTSAHRSRIRLHVHI